MISELALQVVNQLRQESQTISVAESCTGGQIAAAITKVPGSSAVFIGGVVAYANTAKQSMLGVDEATLQKYGAVCGQVATQMAAGARKCFGTDYAVSTTGIAGPGGGTPDKPVGLVWIAWDSIAGASCKSFNFAGSRTEIQAQAVIKAMRGILR